MTHVHQGSLRGLLRHKDKAYAELNLDQPGLSDDALLDAIEAHTLARSGELRDKVAAIGLPIMTPAEPAHRAGSVAFIHHQPERLRQALEAAGVLVTGEYGRVRASVHVHTTTADLDRLDAQLRAQRSYL